MAEMTFNEKLVRLEEIVSILEKGDSSLEDSLTLFEEGSRLAKECNTALQTASLKLKTFGEENEQ